jgi:hypothetical protein
MRIMDFEWRRKPSESRLQDETLPHEGHCPYRCGGCVSRTKPLQALVECNLGTFQPVDARKIVLRKVLQLAEDFGCHVAHRLVEIDLSGGEVLLGQRLLIVRHSHIYFSDALTFARYSAAFWSICAAFRVSTFASRTTGFPFTITSRTSSAFSA